MKKFIAVGLLSVVVLFGFYNMAYGQIPLVCQPGTNYDAAECYRVTTNPQALQNQINSSVIFLILQNVAGFLITAAGVIAGIVIIVAGLVWVTAGSDTGRLTSAKGIFKNGVIGALVLFAVGIIINTIIAIATNWTAFFN